MPYIAPPFTPTVTISGTDLIRNTDEKLQTIANDVGDYLEVQSQAMYTDLDAQMTVIEGDYYTVLKPEIEQKMNDLLSIAPDDTYYTKSAIDTSLALKSDKVTQNWRDSMMSKAQFNALASERRVNRAGSGYDELDTVLTSVNSGISTSLVANTFTHGNARFSINGAIARYLSQSVIMPTAPTVLPYGATLTPEQIASGVIKHADASNSGLIVNGKFDTDTSGWSNYDASLSIDANRLKITSNTGSTSGTFGVQTLSNLVVGKKYIVEFNVISISSGSLLFRVGSGTAIQPFINIYSTTPIIGRNNIEFTATLTNHHIFMGLVTSAGQNAVYDNIAVYPADAISRSDIVFPESWHEDVSEKDFVYPLGNVQYLGGATDGLSTPANGAFSGFGTYSLFGNWQTPSALIGKGYVWSALTDAQKKAFVANPENNMYLDGDTYVQVRYRVRVQLGEDTWTMSKATVQGKAIIPSTVLYTSPLSIDYGAYYNTSATYSYASSYSIPLALIHRRNQGGYNATYNANGTKAMTMTPLNISDCFNNANLTTATGYIGTSTPRPDGLFYDQVSAEDFKPSNKGADLRNNSKKRTAQSIIEEFAPKVLASTIPYYNNNTTPLTTYKDTMEVRDTSGNRYPLISKVGNVVTIGATVANKKGFSIVTQNGKQYLQVADDVASDATVQMNLSTIKYDIGVFDA